MLIKHILYARYIENTYIFLIKSGCVELGVFSSSQTHSEVVVVRGWWREKLGDSGQGYKVSVTQDE